MIVGEPKVDYEAMLQAALLRIVNTDDVEKDLYTLLNNMAVYRDVVNIVAKNFMRMDITDQVILLKASLIQGEVSRQLQQKYGF